MEVQGWGGKEGRGVYDEEWMEVKVWGSEGSERMSTEEGRGVYDDEGRLAKCKDEEVMRGGKSKDKEGGGEGSERMRREEGGECNDEEGWGECCRGMRGGKGEEGRGAKEW